MKRTIIIDDNGQINYLHASRLAHLEIIGRATRRRASHIHPTNVVLRFAFYAIRFLFGENSPIGDWTRRWTCLWTVDLALSGGPAFGRYRIRAEAIEAEEAWLADKMERPASANN